MEVLALGLALETLRATDVDGDGVHELVGSGRDGDKAVLVVVDDEITLVDLGAEAAWWDAAHGIWKVDAKGLVRVGEGRIATVSTPLAYVGPTAPAGTCSGTSMATGWRISPSTEKGSSRSGRGRTTTASCTGRRSA